MYDDPYPRYAMLRRNAPLFFRESTRWWILSRYEDVQAALRDDRLQPIATRSYLEFIPADERAEADELVRGMDRWMLFARPPSHARLRGVCAKAFTPRAVLGLEERVRVLVDELLSAVNPGEFDLVSTLAEPLPTFVIAEMLGAPIADRALFRRWSDDLAAFFEIGPGISAKWRQAATSFSELDAYLRDLVAERRRKRTADLTSAFVTAADEARAVSDDEVIANLALLLFAGHETTMNLIGNGMLALLRDRRAFDDLRAHPEIGASAIEELLRYDSPAQAVPRTAREDLVLHEQTIRGGDVVVMLLGSANRDEAAFADPDRLDLRRPDNKHLAFGHGNHFCLGAPLARLEGQIAIGELVMRFPTLTLDERQPIAWRSLTNLRGLARLPVKT